MARNPLAEESQGGAIVVGFVPTRTDTAWWHDYSLKGEIRFLRGRLKLWIPFFAVNVFSAKECRLMNQDMGVPGKAGGRAEAIA